MLISLNADSSICIWETTSADEFLNAFNEGKFEKWLKLTKVRMPLDTISDPIPTTSCFLNTDYNQFVCGFNDAYISVFDLNKASFTSNIRTFKNDKNSANRINLQPNCIVSCSSVPTIYSGFEDNSIKSIDMRTGKLNLIIM
jgi:WD40 repeat protein